MIEGTVLWAGKRLTPDEEEATRWMIGVMRRSGDTAGAERFERFLPENEHAWTPDQLEAGAHVGPWCDLRAEVDHAASPEPAGE
jgi:hypothetical protein